MNIIVERLPDCRATLRVEVSPSEVQGERTKVTALFAGQARIPGFRPGKAPRQVIEKRFQKQIDDEVRERLVQRGFQEGMKKESLEILRITKLDDEGFRIDDSFSFTADIQTAPEFNLPDYDGISVTVPEVMVSDEEVQERMEALRQRLAEYDDVTDRPLETEDFAVLDFDTQWKGQPLAEAKPELSWLAHAEGQWMRIAGESFVPGFCEKLTGMISGDEREFDLELDKEFPEEEMQGETIQFRVRLQAIKTKRLPEWSDELAGRVEKGMDLETLRERIAESIESEQDRQREEEMTTQILEYFDNRLDFELPESILNEETQRQVNELVYRGQMHGLTDEQISEQQDAIIQHAATQAQVSVKTSFILRQIAEKENIEASEKEILAYCSHLAESNQMPLKKYLSHVKKQGAIGSISSRIVRAKTLDFLRENANIIEISRDEFAERQKADRKEPAE